MTERNEWKPVAHDSGCRMYAIFSCSNDGTKYELPCTCNGTRWSGYGERVGDCAAVYALCAWFGAMRDDDRLDAARYRWLRGDTYNCGVFIHIMDPTHIGDDLECVTPETTDSYVDMAMLAAQQPKKEA